MILALLAGGAVALFFWTRMQLMESAMADLVDRIRSLEEWRARMLTPPPAVSETAKPIAPAAAVHPPVAPSPVAPPPVVAIPPRAVPPPVVPRPVVPPPAAPPPSMPAASTPATPTMSMPAPTSTAPLPSPPQVEAPRPVAAASATPTVSAPMSQSEAREALETRIGSRWLLYVGVVAIVVGVAYFEKLAIDNHWVGETTRVIQGAIVGFLLIAGGLQFVRRGYSLYGQILSGSGVAILYVSTYAAFNLYQLIGQPVAFTLMFGITTLAAWLADRQRSQGLALVAVGGGFATPFLLPSSTDAEAALFGYDAILIAGTMFLARRRDWPLLNVVSYVFTVLTFLGWAANFYASSKFLITEIFLTVFCGMFLYLLREIRHSTHPSAKAERAILWTAPAGYYVVSLIILAQHSAALLVYLIALSFIGVVVGSRTGSWIRLAFWMLVAAPLLLWSAVSGTETWLVPGLAAWTGVYVLNLAGLFEGTIGQDRNVSAADIALLHLNGLLSFGGAYLLLDPVRASATGPLAIALAVVNGALAFLILKRYRDAALHFAALAFTLLTIAIALELEGAAMTSAWAAEGAVVAWLGLRERREWLRIGGLALFAVAILDLLTLQFSVPWARQLVLVNRRGLSSLFVIALTYGLAFVHHRYGDPARREMPTGVALLVAQLLVLSTAVSEILGYWVSSIRPPFEPAAQMIDAILIVGATITWQGLRRRQEWFRMVGAVIVALGAYWLFAVQLLAAPAHYTALLNARAATGLLAVITLYALVVAHRRWGSHVVQLTTNIAVLTTSASLLTLSLLSSEIDAFWAARGAADVWSMAREGLQAIAWGGIGGFLVWQGLSNRRIWVRAVGGVLLAIGVLRLLRLQFAAAAPSYVVVANARVMASIVMIAIVYGLASLYRQIVDPDRRQSTVAMVLWLAANVLTLTLLTSEITAYWHVHDIRHLSSVTAADSHFAREMMLSITWAAYATLLIVVGLRRRYAPIRYFAMTVFVITIVKVFAVDLAELDRLYRVMSIIGLGVMLLLTSYLYQRIAPQSDQG